MSEHTSEPWTMAGFEIVTRVRRPALTDKNNETFIGSFSLAVDARRAAACVNACKGISTHGLEAAVKGDWPEGWPGDELAPAMMLGLQTDLTEALRLLRDIEEWADHHDGIFVWGSDAEETLHDDEGWQHNLSEIRAFLAAHPEVPL